MVAITSLSVIERSQIYWFFSDCFLQSPASMSADICKTLNIPTDSTSQVEAGKEFTRLFRGVQEGYGPPPPYESLYRPCEFPGDIVTAVLSYFQSAGLEARTVCSEPPDFIASELRLLSLLAFKENEALQQCNQAQALFYQNLHNQFLQHHLQIWVPGYCQQLAAAARIGAYQDLANRLNEFLIAVSPEP